MARPREFDMQKALNNALELFWEKGYEATSITDLTTRMEISRPSLYMAFGDKRSLFMKALDIYMDQFLRKLQTILAANGSGYKGIEALLRDLVESVDDIGIKRGCLFVNTMTELAAHDEQIALKGREYQDKVSKFLENALIEGKEAGDIAQTIDVHSTAHFLTLALVGLYVVIKIEPDPIVLKHSIEVTLGVLR